MKLKLISISSALIVLTAASIVEAAPRTFPKPVNVSIANLSGEWHCSGSGSSSREMAEQFWAGGKFVKSTHTLQPEVQKLLKISKISAMYESKHLGAKKPVRMALAQVEPEHAQFISTSHFVYFLVPGQMPISLPVQDGGVTSNAITIKQDTGKASTDFKCQKTQDSDRILPF
jgi:hypothetical protein